MKKPDEGNSSGIQRRYPPGALVRLNACHHLMLSELQSVRNYVETIDASLRSEYERFEKRVAEEVDGMDQEFQDGYVEDCSQTAEELREHFPKFAWQWCFVAVYSLLEDEMTRMARTVGHHLGVQLDPADLKDRGIFAAKKFLNSLCGIRFPESDRPWQNTVEYNRVRNVIVHLRGRVRGAQNEKKVRDFAKRVKTLSIDRFDQLEVSRPFCFGVIEDVEKLLQSLFELARDRIRDSETA